MASSIIESEHAPIRSWAPPHTIEPDALKQLRAIASLPWVAHHVAVMPDVHLGRGATVGSVIALRGAVAPAAVGVDIGCGMTAVRTTLLARQLPDDLKRLREDIEARIPVGRASHHDPVWDEATDGLRAEARALFGRFGELTSRAETLARKAEAQLG